MAVLLGLFVALMVGASTWVLLNAARPVERATERTPADRLAAFKLPDRDDENEANG
jgi:hypothetical protein